VAFFSLASAKQIMFSTHLEKKLESAYKKPGKKKIGRGAAWLAFSFFLSNIKPYGALICSPENCLWFLWLPVILLREN